jgi:hypothetical protein
MDDEALARQKRDAATKCKSCAAPIRWAKTGAGKHMPLDYDEHEGGNVFFFKDGTCYVGKQDDPTPVDATRHYSHFSTCPSADRHRMPRLGEDVSA